MNIITSKRSKTKTGILMSFLILCCLCNSEIAFSVTKRWNSTNINVGYKPEQKNIGINFLFYDYDYGPWSQDGYIEYADFYYSTDGVNFVQLMRIETPNQRINFYNPITSSWLNLKNKLAGAQLQFSGSHIPVDGTFWADSIETQRVEVLSDRVTKLTVNWFVGDNYKNVKYIKVEGVWNVNNWQSININEKYGVFIPSLASKEKYTKNSVYPIKSGTKLSKNNTVKRTTETGVNILKGADCGEHTKTYTISGAQIK